jgi:hypothetical protein
LCSSKQNVSFELGVYPILSNSAIPRRIAPIRKLSDSRRATVWGWRVAWEDSMKRIASFIAAFGLVLGVSGATALAGSPDTPGGHGRLISDAASSEQGIGDVASDPDEGRSNNGESVRKAKTDEGGNPNSGSDSGGGND